jgi:hypothetical protein
MPPRLALVNRVGLRAGARRTAETVLIALLLVMAVGCAGGVLAAWRGRCPARG